jgi:predicted nucleic acid-binding protein
MDKPTLLTVARFKVRFHISLADALIAAFAVRQEAILVHKDPELEALADTIQQGVLAYKP